MPKCTGNIQSVAYIREIAVMSLKKDLIIFAYRAQQLLVFFAIFSVSNGNKELSKATMKTLYNIKEVAQEYEKNDLVERITFATEKITKFSLLLVNSNSKDLMKE
jgi:hypothetical protein